MELIIGVLIALVGILGYNITKRRSAEALLENNKVKDELNKADSSIAKDEGLLSAEEAKRNAIGAERTQNKGNTNESREDLTSWLNKP